ncbi:hypothetical protein CYLTODRAFT_493693 [Cylindrobasidium torrendii FP15055 ss-10]|uniref:Golgi apparatus membrane protein TVP38 n=1 Tax=Cylindrobasidium torrendii FP15055 ss-10 TaxID=1314674 RepID=A0A0D7B2H1_9AGAR|nr:hypothetical protein CYLTODRAFT_493693 [Cylindrobasidium torrendii FP15055 ss-10]
MAVEMAQYELPRHRNPSHDQTWATPIIGLNSHPYPPGSVPASNSAVFNDRNVSRTPSPTPSEQKELGSGAIDWKSMASWRFWLRREWLWYYVAFVLIMVITALVTLYHKQIVEWLTPVTEWMHELSWGWVIPILVLFVISFPPLFGHEIVAVLCGLVWGLWIGFGIVCAGTFIGEVGNFYAFKYCCRARGEKLERTNISYACLARVVRDGGFRIALIARLSAIPGHFTTAVFSTCGMGIFVFSIAAILSMPKQFITVYLGVILHQSSSGTQDTKSRIISDVVIAVTFIITIAAMWYIYRQMNKVKPDIIYARRKARQAKMARAADGTSPYSFTPDSQTSEINLITPRPQYSFTPKGTSTGSSPVSTPYAPYKPTRANSYGYSKSEDAMSSSDHSTTEMIPESRESVDVTWDSGRPEPYAPPGIPPSYGAHPYATAAPVPVTPTTPRAPPTVPSLEQTPYARRGPSHPALRTGSHSPSGPTAAEAYAASYTSSPQMSYSTSSPATIPSTPTRYAPPVGTPGMYNPDAPDDPRTPRARTGFHEVEPTMQSYHTAVESQPPPRYF